MKTILITGGSGFLGKELAKQLKGSYRVILGARNNGNNLFAKMETGCETIPLDIVNYASLIDSINEFKPEIIIHAAATKFVDISEVYPMECIDVNIIGSQNVARAAIEKGVETVIGVSTDKAAPPVGNIYGHSKAIMERLFSSMDKKSSTRFACVRFGNIAWSTGSVFPIWQKMAKEKGKIETTGPHMRRFFFTVKDAAGLVIRAMKNIDHIHGGVLSLKMKAAQVEDLLNVWSESFGTPWEKIAERPGDKLDEVLIGQSELIHTEVLSLDGFEHYLLNFSNKYSSLSGDEIASYNAERLSKDEMIDLIKAGIEK